MKRCTPGPGVRYLASSAIYATMSLRPSFRGSRGWRNYSDRPYSNECAYTGLPVTRDSHFQQVQVSNQGFWPLQYDVGSYWNVPQPNFYHLYPHYDLPPQLLPPQNSHQLDRPPQPHNRQFDRPTQQHQFDKSQQPQQHQFDRPLQQNRQFDRPPQQPYYNHQFRPWQQQFRPRPQRHSDFRSWEGASPGPPPQCERFTVLSYNILADYLIRDHWSKLYFHIPGYVLDWKQRKRSIIFELGLWSADILCLQEVDKFADLKEELELQGYNGIWKRRTGFPSDGCAIFWRNSRFKLLHEESLEFSKFGMRDNVAQICVLQSLDQCKDSETSASTSSSNQANKVVVCNIHVLFNPRRGDIKLGQVRVLLNRAHGVSTLWDDAPIVICGDFNSTPKSPLYNFISEQKLDLSDLPRDKVSGQASAEIHPTRPYNPNSGALNSAPAAPLPSNIKGVVVNSLVDERREIPGENQGNQFSTNLARSEFCMVRDSVESCISKKDDKGSNCKPVGDSPDVMNGNGGENYAANHLPHNGLGANPSLHRDKASPSYCFPTFHESNLQMSYFEHAKCDSTNGCDKERESVSISELPAADSNNNSVNSDEYDEKSSFDLFSSSPPSSVPNEDSTSTAHGSGGYDVLHEAINRDLMVDGKMESSSFDEVLDGTTDVKNIGEDRSSFLSELHSTCGPFPSWSRQAPSSDELGDSHREQISPQSQQPKLINNGVLDVTYDPEPCNITPEKTKYDPSTWTPVELETATGSAHCSVMEHPLKLRSVYGEIQDYSGTRDSTGEPAVTSYHRRFLGTVDYIWRSEGLQTVRVLAPLPKHAMLWTSGFPTKKWGSDHIALVSELAFTNNTPNQKPDIQSQNAC